MAFLIFRFFYSIFLFKLNSVFICPISLGCCNLQINLGNIALNFFSSYHVLAFFVAISVCCLSFALIAGEFFDNCCAISKQILGNFVACQAAIIEAVRCLISFEVYLRVQLQSVLSDEFFLTERYKELFCLQLSWLLYLQILTALFYRRLETLINLHDNGLYHLIQSPA